MAKAAEDLTIQGEIDYHERHIAVLENYLNTSVAGPHEKQSVADLERPSARPENRSQFCATSSIAPPAEAMIESRLRRFVSALGMAS